MDLECYDQLCDLYGSSILLTCPRLLNLLSLLLSLRTMHTDHLSGRRVSSRQHRERELPLCSVCQSYPIEVAQSLASLPVARVTLAL